MHDVSNANCMCNSELGPVDNEAHHGQYCDDFERRPKPLQVRCFLEGFNSRITTKTKGDDEATTYEQIGTKQINKCEISTSTKAHG